jgi:flagellin
MALPINTNISSQNAQRYLQTSGKEYAKSLERLSSGLRINRAGDDAAGLAISTRMTSQIRGLNQAIRNANDGMSLVSTAESAIGQIDTNLQRIRELAVQASNDTYTSSDRASMQQEIDNLISEITRTGDTVTFNGKKIIDGTFTDQKLQIGAQRAETLSLSLGDLRSSALGAVAEATGTAVTSNAFAAGDLLVNGEDVGASADDGISTTEATASAIAKATAINSVSGTTGVTAEVNAAVATGGAGITAGTLDGTNSLTINNVRIDVTVSLNDSDGALRDKINSYSNQTGVVATLNTSNRLVLTAADGRNVDVALAGTGGTFSGMSAAVSRGTITLTSNENIQLTGANETYAGFTNNQVISLDLNTAINKTALVTTQSDAQNTIRRIDFAINQVIEERAKMGAITNRLDQTVANLSTVVENFESARSRIRDADFAVETAQLTRNSILQQAGTAMLAQANVAPQNVLSLLRG